MDNNVLMINNIISEQEQQLLIKAIEESENVVVVAHTAPDGDAVGSSLALSGVLKKMGKNVGVVMPDALPKSIMFLQGATDIKIYKDNIEKPIVKQKDNFSFLVYSSRPFKISNNSSYL